MVARHLKDIVAAENIHLAIANVEGAAGGFGITPQLADELFDLRPRCTRPPWQPRLGQTRDLRLFHPQHPRLLRPANYVEGFTPVRGVVVVQAHNGVDCAVINLQGRVYMPTTRLPLPQGRQGPGRAAGENVKVRFVDFHAEEFPSS